MSTKVIFRRAEVFVLAEVCLLRRPHAEVGLHTDVSEDFRSSKNNFCGNDISQGLDREPPSLSPHFLLL